MLLGPSRPGEQRIAELQTVNLPALHSRHGDIDGSHGRWRLARSDPRTREVSYLRLDRHQESKPYETRASVQSGASR
jgi:hypothetical protein